MFKLQGITQLAIAIGQKLVNSTITCVRTHVKSMVVIGLEIESSAFEIHE